MQPTRRSYSKSFKAQVIQECSQPDVSIANAAMNHGLNANLVHKWIRVLGRQDVARQSAFIPLKLQASAAQPETNPATIRIEVPHDRGAVVVSWPVENAAACTHFLRDLLR